ncbi:MAG TPA: hypothetical protein VFU37_17870 [Pyrinomonadaceae bacterium]|nr:hypothetical protein [Pyrinomonadaceae bacterium]
MTVTVKDQAEFAYLCERRGNRLKFSAIKDTPKIAKGSLGRREFVASLDKLKLAGFCDLRYQI